MSKDDRVSRVSFRGLYRNLRKQKQPARNAGKAVTMPMLETIAECPPTSHFGRFIGSNISYFPSPSLSLLRSLYFWSIYTTHPQSHFNRSYFPNRKFSSTLFSCSKKISNTRNMHMNEKTRKTICN